VEEGKFRVIKCAVYPVRLLQLGLGLGLRLRVAIGALLAPGEDERAARGSPQLDPQQRRRRGGARERAQGHASPARAQGSGGDGHGSCPTTGGAERGHVRNCAHERVEFSFRD
jgi:hypothetical protein